MQEKKKLAVVAGLLGMFLGIFGGHDWYLGKTKQAITHVCVTVIGAIVAVVGAILLNISEEGSWLMTVADVLIIGAYVVLATNFIWGFIVGIAILMRGNVGLAAAGYATNNDMMMQANGATAAAEPVAPATPVTPVVPAAPEVSAAPVNTAVSAVNESQQAVAPTTNEPQQALVPANQNTPVVATAEPAVATPVAPAAPIEPAAPVVPASMDGSGAEGKEDNRLN